MFNNTYHLQHIILIIINNSVVELHEKMYISRGSLQRKFVTLGWVV